jgi:hypothetical protein
MSTDPGSPYQSPLGGSIPPPPRRGRGTLLALGLGCGTMLLLCCGGIGGIFFLVWSSSSSEPADVRRVAAEIADVPLPAEFEPQGSIDMPVSFFGAKMKGVLYETKKKSAFVMAEFSAKLSEAERENFFETIRMRLHTADDKLDILETKTVDFTMRGEPASFKFAKVQNVDTKQKFWRAAGTFEGKGGPAMVMMMVPLEDYNEAQLKQIFENTK